MNEDAAFLGNPYELKIRYSRFYNVDLLINQIAIRSIEKLSKSVDPVPEAIKFKPIIIHRKKKKNLITPNAPIFHRRQSLHFSFNFSSIYSALSYFIS